MQSLDSQKHLSMMAFIRHGERADAVDDDPSFQLMHVSEMNPDDPPLTLLGMKQAK